MKATDFANFFEFFIQTKKDYGDIVLTNDDYDIENKDIPEIKYIVTDNQGIFHNRYIREIKELTDCFDSMLSDYIDSMIEEDGFEYDKDNKDTYYEQALKWCEKGNESEFFTDIIRALVNPSTIENDLQEN
jgi:hypothetical protein